MSDERTKAIRDVLYRAAGIIPDTPALPLQGCALGIRRNIIAQARADRPADSDDLTDDEVWDRARGMPVTVEMLTASIGSIIDAVSKLEQRIAALENPKQPWEQ